MPLLSDEDKKFITGVIDMALQAASKEISFVIGGTMPDSGVTYAAGTSVEVVEAILQPDVVTK